MNSLPPTERDRQRSATRQRIVDAAFTILRDEPTSPFSHEAAAARAGISARTVYRHFPTQNDLVAAVWMHLRDSTGTRWPKREEDIIPFLRELYEQFERNAALTRAVMAAQPRADYAAHGSAEGRSAFRQALAARCADLAPEQANQLIATCVAIYSAPFWQMLRDRGQLSPAETVEAAECAMSAVLSAPRRT